MKRVKNYIEIDKLTLLEEINRKEEVIKIAEILLEMVVIKSGAAQEVLEFYGNDEGSLIELILNETRGINYIDVEEIFEMIFGG